MFRESECASFGKEPFSCQHHFLNPKDETARELSCGGAVGISDRGIWQR